MPSSCKLTTYHVTETTGIEAFLIPQNESALAGRNYLWTPAQRQRASMLYFANVIYLFIFFMAALFSGPG